MRKRKWLLIVVVIIIMINLLFWGMTYLFDVNSYIKDRLTKTIGRDLNATISFSALNLTSKILQISDLEIIHNEGDFILRAKQLYLHFSFWELLLHKFQFAQALKEIRCFSPEIIYNASYDKEQTKLNIDIDALEKTLIRFDYISVINGQVSVNSKGEIVFSENLEKINVSLQKQQDKKWHIKMSAFQSGKEGSIDLDGIYAKQSNQFKIMFKDYDVPKINTTNAALTGSRINAEFEATLSEISKGTVRISNIESTFHDESISSKEVAILLTPDSLKIDKNAKILWNNNVILCDGYISNYLSNNSHVDISFQMNGFNIASLDEKISGLLDMCAEITGNYTSPKINFNFTADKLFYNPFELNNVSSEIIYADRIAEITKSNFKFEHNRVDFSGKIAVNENELLESNLDIVFKSGKFKYPIGTSTLQSDVEVEVSGIAGSPEICVSLDQFVVVNNNFHLPQLSGNISYANQKATYDLKDSKRSLLLKGDFDISPTTPFVHAEIFAHNLAMTNILRTEIPFLNSLDPHVNAQLLLTLKEGVITPDGWFDFADNINSSVKGSILISGKMPVDLTGKTGFLSIRSDTLSISHESCDFIFNSTLYEDDRIAADMQINNNIYADATINLKQDDIQYSGALSIDSLYVNRLNNILHLFETDTPLSGMLNADFAFDSSQEIPGKGSLDLTEFSFNENINPVYVTVDLQTDSSEVTLNNIHVQNSQSLLKGNARLYLAEGNFECSASEEDVVLENFLKDIPVKGKASYALTASGNLNAPRVLCDISVENGTLYNTAFSSFVIHFFQDFDMFYLNEMEIIAPDFNLTGSGSYSYNFITEEFQHQTDNIKFHFSGDLLKILIPYVPDMKQASSTTELFCSFITDETNTIVDSASLHISDGQFSIKSQPEKIRDLSCTAEVKENVMTKFAGSFRMGGGKLFFKNIINNDESDIFAGNINVGSIKLNTDDQGITIHIPNYQPEKGIVDAQLTGYEDEYFTVYNENGAWVLSGRILLSNGDAIYEAGEESEEVEDSGLPPVYADFDLVFDKNTWFVSNPFNLKIDSGNYMSFRTNRDTEEPELYFDLHSQKGEMRLFGESFSVEDVIVRKARQDEKVFINATFTKRTPDGSMIYLHVQSTEDKLNADDIGTDAYGDVEVSLRSDNPEDVTMLSILSKIQYGKDINELSEDERFDLGRAQAINLASDELSNLIFSPLISPIEGVVRQILGLDYVRFKTGFMKNIIQTSGIVESDDNIIEREYDSDLELLGELSKDILLENLAIDLGKYITPEWYLNYEALIKKEMTSRNETYIGVQHELSLTWELPYNFRFIYRYQFYPAQGKDNQGISLETVFHF